MCNRTFENFSKLFDSAFVTPATTSGSNRTQYQHTIAPAPYIT
jgi:hypothetical protein